MGTSMAPTGTAEHIAPLSDGETQRRRGGRS